MYELSLKRALTAGVVLALLLAGRSSPAQENPGTAPPGVVEAAPAATATQAELEALKQQIYELNKALRKLEVQVEDEKKVNDDRAKKAPVVAASSEGFTITSPDKAHQLRIGGRIAYDVAFFDQDSELKSLVGDEQDGTGFRYARLRLQGTSWENVAYQMEIDFSAETGADSPIFRDVYLELRGIPYGVGDGATVRVGHFREPFSLEELTPVPYRTFNERSLANVFVPSRNAGVQITDAWLGEAKKERLTLSLGAFKETDDWPSSNDSDEDQGYQLTGRLTGLPLYKNDGRQLVHLGVAYSRRNPDGATLRYSTRPESRLSLFRYTNVEGLPAGFRLSNARADDVNLLGAELAAVIGPLSLQGEYIQSEVDTTFGGDYSFSGYYAQASYFLTGEHRPYRNTEGIFGRVVPNHNFGWKGKDGWGAWEVTARYSKVDLQDGFIRGGEQDSITAGLNWYLNPNARITWNYIHNTVNHDLYDGDFGIFQTRFQLEF